MANPKYDKIQMFAQCHTGMTQEALAEACGTSRATVRRALAKTTISTGATKVFGYTDIHWGDRDERALAVAQHAQEVFQPDITIIGGDLLNMAPFARHRIRTIDEARRKIEYDYPKDELYPANKFLDFVQKNTAKQTVFLEGNHDAWLESWIVDTPGASAFRSLRPRLALGAGRENFTYVNYNREKEDRKCFYHLRDDIWAVHGWTVQKHAAWKTLEIARDVSVIYNHTHRPDQRWGRLSGGKLITSFSAGCLCRLDATYLTGGYKEWAHGFWVAYIGRVGWMPYIITIDQGKAVLPDGTEVLA